MYFRTLYIIYILPRGTRYVYIYIQISTTPPHRPPSLRSDLRPNPRTTSLPITSDTAWDTLAHTMPPPTRARRCPAKKSSSILLITLLLLAAAPSATALHSTACLLASVLARAPEVPDGLRAELNAFRGGCSVQDATVHAVERCLQRGKVSKTAAALLPALPPAPVQRRLSTTCAFQNAASGPHDVPANCFLTAEVNLTADMRIQGQGATIDRGDGGRHYFVPSGVTLVLRWLRLVRGQVSTSACSSPHRECSGGIVYVRGTLDMWRVEMNGGTAYDGGAVAVFYGGAVSVNMSTIHGNTATRVSESLPLGRVATFSDMLCKGWRRFTRRGQPRT